MGPISFLLRAQHQHTVAQEVVLCASNFDHLLGIGCQKQVIIVWVHEGFSVPGCRPTWSYGGASWIRHHMPLYSTVLCVSTVLTSFHVRFSSVRLYQSTASLLNLDCQPTIKCLDLVDVYNSQRMTVVSKVLNGKPWWVNCGSPVGSLLLILLHCDFTDTHWKMSPLTWTKCLWWCRRRDSRTRRATIRRCPGPESIRGREALAGSCWGAGRWSVAGTSTPLFC